MVQLQVKFDDKQVKRYNQALGGFIKDLGYDAPKTIKQYSRLLAEDLMEQCPPFEGKTGSNTQAARKSGLEKIKRDLLRSVTPADYIFKDSFNNKHLEKIIKRHKWTQLDAAMQNMPKFQSWRAVPFDEGAVEAKKPDLYWKGKQNNLVTLDQAKWKRYLKKLQDRVGYMKAGFGVAVSLLGGKVQSWIAKHLGYARGYCFDETDNTMSPHVEFGNTTPTVGRYNHRFNYAITKRADKMFRDLVFKINNRLKSNKLVA